jgi:hypothetical protein
LTHFTTTYSERKANHVDHEGARVWVLDQFAALGLETYRHNFTAGGLDQSNLLGIKWGEQHDKWVVVGGHYDMTTTAGVDQPTSQGAYDNGSGTMLTLALAKAFAELDTNYTLVFVPFDGEERGTQGARAFVQTFITGYGERNYTDQPYGSPTIVGVLNLDMIGLNWPGVMAPINVIDNSNALYNEVKAKADELGFPDNQIKRKGGLTLGSSDYARFWEVTEEYGGPIPTVFLISDFEELGAPAPAPNQVQTPMGAYPFWHVVDTMESMIVMAGGEANLQAGFQSAADISAQLIWRLASDQTWEIDAVVK